MALVNLANRFAPLMPWPNSRQPNPSAGTMNAAGESQFGIGYLYLSSGPGTSKTLSAAGGGSIYWRTGAVTFSNAGTSVDIGLQDVSAGLEDGSYDVSATLVGGTDTISANASMQTVMETGSKTVAHGDKVAIGLTMTARGGSDVVNVLNEGGWATLGTYMSVDTGAGPTRAVGNPMFTILFDDGTYGWLVGSPGAHGFAATGFNSGSTPDEYATIFTATFATQIVGVCALLDDVATADDFELILYSDPLGTPVAERTVAYDPNLTFATNGDGQLFGVFTSAYTPVVGNAYAVAVRPTTANNISLLRLQFGTSNSGLRIVTALGTDWQEGTRSNQTGAFSGSTINLPIIGPILQAFDNGAGSSSGLLVHPGMVGGLRG